MPVSQETLKVNGWSVQRKDWADEAGRVEYSLFPPGVPIDQAPPAIELFLQKNIGIGETDLRFPTQLTAADFLSQVNRFVSETREVQAPSRHELVLERIRKCGLDMETIESSLQREIASQTKMYGLENGVYVFNNTDDETSVLESEEGFEIKMADLPEAGSELNTETLEVNLRRILPDQSLYDSEITVATESAVVAFFPDNFGGKELPHICVYAPAEHLSMILSLMHNSIGVPGFIIPMDYLDRVLKSQLGQV